MTFYIKLEFELIDKFISDIELRKFPFRIDKHTDLYNDREPENNYIIHIPPEALQKIEKIHHKEEKIYIITVKGKKQNYQIIYTINSKTANSSLKIKKLN